MNLDVTFSSNENKYDVDMQIDNAVTVVHDDHALLSNRDAADAHPISAITWLEEALANAASSADVNAAIAEHNKSGDAHADIRKAIEEKTVDLSGYAEKSELEGYLPLTGGTLSGGVIAPNFQTGMDNSAYFQTKKMRGQGDANTYNHAVDWGYAGHDKVDFYEYGGTWNFYQCQGSSIKAARLIGSIGLKGWNGGAVLTGTPTAPTADEGTSTTQIATTEFVMNAIADKVSLEDVQTAIAGALAGLDASGVSY